MFWEICFKKCSLIIVNCIKVSVTTYLNLFWSKMRVEIILHKIQDIHKVWDIGKVLKLFDLLSPSAKHSSITIVCSIIPFCKTSFNIAVLLSNTLHFLCVHS